MDYQDIFDNKHKRSFYGLSAEHKAALAAANTGRACSPEARQARSEALRGKVFSEEHKAKLSEIAFKRTLAQRQAAGQGKWIPILAPQGLFKHAQALADHMGVSVAYVRCLLKDKPDQYRQVDKSWLAILTKGE
jgi:hypothetical protein